MNTMGEVATLTDKLALMPDQMLPRLAQQYKNDAITLSLILGEKNRRDRVRNSVKAQAGAQPQPRVNEQIVAGMQAPLPEQVGIGALPAPNMQQMADGGIAGMPEDDNSSLVYHNEPVMRMAEGGVARYNGNSSSVVNENPLAIGTFIRKWRESGQPLLPYLGIDTKRAVDEGLYDTTPTGPSPSNAEIEQSLGLAALTPEGKPAPKADAAVTPTDYTVLNKLMGGPRTGGVAPMNLQQQYANILKGQNSEDPAAKERKALQEQLVSSAEQSKRDIEADQAKRGDVYKGREARLTKREQELEKSKESNTGLALLEAGLSIMSTPGHWAQAIGQGAKAGVARYAEGIDKLRAAQERLGEARDRMEDLKINRDDMNARDIRQANDAINRAKMDAQKLSIDAIMARDNVNRDTAKSIFAATVQQNIAAMETSSRERIAAMPGANERIALLLGGGNLEKGLTRLTDIQAGKFNPTTAYTEYLSKRKEGDTVLSPQEFVTQIRSIQALMAGAPAASSKPTGKIYE